MLLIVTFDIPHCPIKNNSCEERERERDEKFRKKMDRMTHLANRILIFAFRNSAREQ